MIKKYSLVLVACFCFILSGFGQVNITPTRTDVAGFPTWTDASVVGTTYLQLLPAGASTISPAMNFNSYTNETLDFTARSFGGVNAVENTVTVSISTDNGGNWTVLGTRTPTNTTLTAQTQFDLSSYNGTQVRLRFAVAGTSNAIGVGIDDINIRGVVPSSDPNLSITGTTTHGPVCVNTAAATVQYTITNSGSIAAAGVTVASNDTQFAVSGLSSTTIAAGGTATYNVTFTPTSTGAKTATITVASTTATSNSPTSSLTGTGATTVAQAIASAAATLVTASSATLNGNVTTLGVCPDTTEKGFVYSETSLNNNPAVGGGNVTKTVVAGVVTGTYTLGLTGLPNGTQYSFKPYVYNGTTYTYGTVRTFTTFIDADFCNLQFPANGTITVGGVFNAYARVYEPGITTNAGANAAITSWIGYSTTNSNPSTAGWTWVQATFSAEFGNDDEYVANIGAAITTANTYYYASRFQINTGPFTYGGISPPSGGGFWNGINFISGILTVNPDLVDFCNLQSPATGNISTGKPYNVFARVYEPGVTPPAGASGAITAWIGYSTTNTNPSTWPAGNWKPASYQGQFGNDDEYVADIGQFLTVAGTYYYASRFQLNGSSYSYGGITPPNGGNFWDGTTNISGVVNVTNPPLAPTGFVACMEDTKANLSWTASATSGTRPTPDGYVVFAIAGGTNVTQPPLDAILYTANSNFAAAPTEVPATLGKVVYKGTATNAVITGLTEDSNYSFTVFAYKNESSTGWSTAAAASRQTNVLAQSDVRNLTANPGTNQVGLSWNNPLPVSCIDELIIVANQGAVTFTPSGSYGDLNVPYSTPNSVVYATTLTNPSSRTITGLTNNLNYCFKVYIRRGSVWSDGVSICATPVLTYCTSDGGTTTASGILNVSLNTINNTSPSTNAYTDFTSISTSLDLGTAYNLSVNVNTGGNYTSYVKVWIDWNQDGVFNNSVSSNEYYELGTIDNVPDGQPDLSPLTVIVPSNAVIGSTHMRVSARTDNSPYRYATPCEDFSFGEVEDYTIIILQPTDAEINIKGANITIPNGFNSPYGLNNTLFAGTNIGATTTPKIFTIENIGLATLNLTGTPIVTLTGANPGDFNITMQPTASSIASNGSLTFRINFSPNAEGDRTAIVSIQNSDVTGGENPYTFLIKGTGLCTATILSTIYPNSGPVGTEVTITSPNNLTGASAILNGMLMTTISSTATELVVQVPDGATTGPLKLYLGTGCSSTNAFTVINNAINGCQASSSSTIPSDLFISEVTDATTGSSSYVEIFNGTAGTINLSAYNIRIFNNGSNSPSSTSNLTGTLASGATHVITLGNTSCTPTNLGSGVVKQSFNTAGGINFDLNSSDLVALYKSATLIDVFGVFGNTSWANSLGIGTNGVDFQRKNTATPLPSTTFNINDWDVIDWTTCGDSNYATLGNYDFSIGVPPSVTLQPVAPTTTCDLSAVLTIAGMEGYNPPSGDTAELTYQWFFNAPGTNVWTEILSSNTAYSGQQTVTLTIPNTLNLDNYQYYCQVRESSVTCFKASNAVKIRVLKSTWDGTTWTPSVPTINTVAILDGNYDMTSLGANQPSFSACQLIVNPGFLLTIEDNKFVEVENNVTIDGNINVKSKGSFVQNTNTGVVNGAVLSTPTKVVVEKMTALMNNWYEYTYWSSPVSGETAGTAFAESNANRRFWYNAANFRDSTKETGNNNATVAGQDDIDDNGDDWTSAPANMILLPGVGYASTLSSSGFTGPGRSYQFTFEGPFNNGIVTVPIYRNDAELADNNWNFIGNPYPSAISANSFLAANTFFDLNGPGGPMAGAIFLWSQNTDASSSTNGNEAQNFAQSDFAIINGTGETAGGDGIIPTRFIPSGQGFFVSMANNATATGGTIKTANVTFNNSMRVKTNNDQFFRSSETSIAENKLWINLTSNNGVFNQILVGYVDGATDGNDGMYYDAAKNLSSGATTIIYTLIADEPDLKLGIQGKDANSLDLDEVIPLGFYTSINEPTNYKLSIADLAGDFLTTNTVYLKDNLMNLTFNLSTGDYIFSSEHGEFNNRFSIVFKEQSLSVIDNEITPNGLTIIELADGRVKFSVGNSLTIQSVEILDMLGRTLYNFKGSNASEVYELSNVSQAAYMAKVTLSNGQVITKRAVKQK